MVNDFIALDDPKNHLYSRELYVELQKFKRSQSIEFFQKGFEAQKKQFDREKLEEIVYALDGMVGLALFGHESVAAKRATMIDHDLQRIVNQ